MTAFFSISGGVSSKAVCEARAFIPADTPLKRTVMSFPGGYFAIESAIVSEAEKDNLLSPTEADIPHLGENRRVRREIFPDKMSTSRLRETEPLDERTAVADVRTIAIAPAPCSNHGRGFEAGCRMQVGPLD